MTSTTRQVKMTLSAIQWITAVRQEGFQAPRGMALCQERRPRQPSHARGRMRRIQGTSGVAKRKSECTREGQDLYRVCGGSCLAMAMCDLRCMVLCSGNTYLGLHKPSRRGLPRPCVGDNPSWSVAPIVSQRLVTRKHMPAFI